jgi:hypothetical protein
MKKVKSFLPPALITTPGGTYAVFGGNWISVPTTTTFEEVRNAWIPDRPKKEKSVVKDVTVKISNSKGTDSYVVTYQRGMWSCSCPGFGFRRKCKHVDQAKLKLNIK